MAVQRILRLLNLLRGTLVLLGDYAENRQIAPVLLDLKVSLFNAIAELERLPNASVGAPSSIESSTSHSPIPRELPK